MFAYENQVLALLKDKLKDYEAKTEVTQGFTRSTYGVRIKE
jgi:hypothetical protein